MKMSQRLERALRSQFQRPSGFWGRAAGALMAHRSSNRTRNVWAAELLEVRPDDRVLEIGFGPGIAIKELSARAPDGYVCGLDHSALMVRQAARRNAKAVRRGQVDLRLGSVDELPDFDAPFDKVLAVNVSGFSDGPAERLENLRRVTSRGGRIALAFQPRGPGATDEAATTAGQEFVTKLRDAGFSQVRLETLKLKPAVVCALGVNPPGESGGS
jgi:SAM-dependent methyltransferase